MKTSLPIVLAASLLTVAVPAAARAQMTESMKFTTAFPFTAGHTDFRPGTYIARPLDGDPTVVRIQNEHGGPTALLVGINAAPKRDPKQSEVTFVREGDRLVLKRIWDESTGEGFETPGGPSSTIAN